MSTDRDDNYDRYAYYRDVDGGETFARPALTQTITLADGNTLTAQGTRDPDAGVDYNTGGALSGAGYASVPNQATLDYFNQTYGTNFATPEQYMMWLYGGGSMENTSEGLMFKTPSGVANTVNQPLSYDPQGFEFGDAVLMGMGAVAGAGLTGMLPGTTNVFSGLGGAGAGVVDVGGQAIDLGGYLTGTDAGASFAGLSGGADAAWGVNARPDLGAMQAIDGSAQTIYDAAANAGLPGYDAGLTSGVAAGGAAGSTLGIPNITNGGFGLGDIFKTGSLANTLLGKVAPAALGAYGASQQADAYRDMQTQYFGLGAPYRDLLQKSYQPGFSLQNEPGFKDAMDTSFNTFMRAASAGNARGVSSGNPFDNPGAIMESQKYLMGNLGLPYLQNYRSGLSQSGQLGLGPAAQFGGNAIQSQGGVYDAVGYGLGEIFNPKKDYGIVIMDGVNNGRYKMGSI